MFDLIFVKPNKWYDKKLSDAEFLKVCIPICLLMLAIILTKHVHGIFTAIGISLIIYRLTYLLYKKD
jgi:hypothetical protein